MWESFKAIFPKLGIKIYLTIFFIISGSFLVSKIINFKANIFLVWLGSYWIAAMLYIFIVMIIVDIVKNFKIIKNRFSKFINFTAIIAMLLTAPILIYGTYNANDIKVLKYNLKINKDGGDLKKLNIAVVSDIHLWKIVGRKLASKMVREINRLNPDVVLIVGDIIDQDIRVFKQRGYGKYFLDIKSKYGVYGVLGNHDYVNMQSSITQDEIVKCFKNSGIHILRDEYVKINNSFYLVGREDKYSEVIKNQERKELKNIIKDIDKNKPIIMMDHQPLNIQEAQRQDVDMMFSGHTHKGQLFPVRMLTKIAYQVDWGYFVKDNFQLIVTSGLGTWGPPVRTGSHSEIINVKIDFR